MSAGAVFKFHGRFNSLNEIKAHIHAGAEYPPQIGDSAQYIEADGSLADASFTSSGWVERSRFNPDGSTSYAGPVNAPNLPVLNPDGSFSMPGPVVAPNSISSFLPGQTAGVPDTATLVVDAGVSQNVALPTGTAFRLDWSGFGPFAFRFGSSSAVAVATDFPGVVGLPQYFENPAGATHIAVYGIGGGTLVVSGGARP